MGLILRTLKPVLFESAKIRKELNNKTNAKDYFANKFIPNSLKT
jgi:hypothetical protein